MNNKIETSVFPANLARQEPLLPEASIITERLAEAARYALLRRLAPAIRHNMAGALQPISMMSAILEKRFQAAAPDLVALGKNSRSISKLSREAASACMELMTWLAPKNTGSVSVSAGVQDVLDLVSTELAFAGFNVANETASVEAEVPLSMLRNAFMASLIAVTDSAKAPGNVLITASAANDELLMVITISPDDSQTAQGSLSGYRVLDWDDVQFLVNAEGVSLKRSQDRVELRCAAVMGTPIIEGG